MIKVGTSGFSFKDWRGVVYAKNIQPKDALFAYQELGFNCVEINSTYYALVSEKSFSGMEAKTKSGFEFTVKAYKGITHDPFDNRLGNKKPNIDSAREDLKKFIYSIQPLKDKKKLGAVLLQFPVFFYSNEENKEYLSESKKAFKDIPVVAEFRNISWAKPENFEFLRQNDIASCSVDEPKLPRLMPFINEVTSSVGYIRLHGRNPNWFNASLAERYNYLYSDKELKEFVPEIKKTNLKASKTFVFFNNCHAGHAAKNALSLLKMLKETR
jgi:uncharacterized protein YecE (DUF72 family)